MPDRDDDGLVSLSDLVRFFNHPIRALIYDRAGLWVTRPDETPDEQIPVHLNGLDAWSIGERLLRLRMAGHEPELLIAAEWRRGYLPPRALGQKAIQGIAERGRGTPADRAAIPDRPTSPVRGAGRSWRRAVDRAR